MPQSFLEQRPPGGVRGSTLPLQLTQALKVSNCLTATMSALEMSLLYIESSSKNEEDRDDQQTLP